MAARYDFRSGSRALQLELERHDHEPPDEQDISQAACISCLSFVAEQLRAGKLTARNRQDLAELVDLASGLMTESAQFNCRLISTQASAA